MPDHIKQCCAADHADQADHSQGLVRQSRDLVHGAAQGFRASEWHESFYHQHESERGHYVVPQCLYLPSESAKLVTLPQWLPLRHQTG